ncbi:hypothetical protein SAMN04488057_101124 [Cyclobacterium lianum]|uniref:PA14 domain-containing protein n=1 Tax=Cyclobacterium lianum TaxID=388280 RepID=A0A1M7HZE6_9BACT|nr:hypothetical protein [Cyclobacterium lianum]SHM33845.1 hypothetical protein SAMN04488057_101124 [Cyclobacterium lianum]
MRAFKQQWDNLSRLGLTVVLLAVTNGSVYAQPDCEPGTIPGGGYSRHSTWYAYVYQLSPDFKPSTDYNRFFVDFSQADKKFKGVLRRGGSHFLPANSLNFDTTFGDSSVDGYSNDENFFSTGADPYSAGGCDTQLQHFGLIMRSRKVMDEPGIYRIRIGSDDGSYFRMYEPNNTSNPILDVNGDPVIHDNWFKDGSDGVYNYVYEDNIRNYYVPFDGGESIWMDLNFYEKTGENRLSFNFELYFGPGEIANPGNAGGFRSYCGIAPDPEPFQSLGPAVFAEGTDPEYQWQYTTLPNPTEEDWIDIAGATGLTYDVPQYDENDPDNNWTGTRYYRRKAQNTAVDGEGNTLVNTFASNVLEVNISVIEELDQNEFGIDEWIGHIYAGEKNFNAQDYLGRMVEQDIFRQDFNYNGLPSSPVTYTPAYGCPFLTDRFSIRYKMKLSVEPGTLRFSVKADDGFRLSVDGGATWLLTGQWESGGSTANTYTAQYDITAGVESLDLVIEYYEATGGNTIDFNYDLESLVLPLQWGDISGQACGEENCLNWTTLQEKNTSHFEIERSLNGQAWTALPYSIPASGQSNALKSYQATDSAVTAKTMYYRVRQIDLDSADSYSEIIRIENLALKKKPLPFPNPTTAFIHFETEEEILAVQLSSQDQRIDTTPDLDRYAPGRYRIDMRKYPATRYLLILQTEKERVVYKIIKR